MTKVWRGYADWWRLAQIVKVGLGVGWAYAREVRNVHKPVHHGLSTNPYRHIRQGMEKLGPTFVKLGQFLSARPDLIPPGLAMELAKLQDRVAPMSQEEISLQLLKAFGGPPEALFQDFDYTPLASASIAQVHRAVLPGGQQVVVKIQRPHLRKIAETDLAILRKHELRIARTFPGRLVDIGELIEDLSRKIQRELDFTMEGFNMDIFRKMLMHIPGTIVPQVHWQYTTREILVMDYIPHVKLEELDARERHRAAHLVLKSLLFPIFKEGIFHGDPHPGNILFLPQGQIAWVDFGSVGRLDDTFRRRMSLLLLAVSQRDAGKVAELTLEWGRVVGPYNPARLYEDTAELLDKISGFGNRSIHLGHLIAGMVEISSNHHIKLPENFFLLGKSLLTGEGLAKTLDPNVNFMEIALSVADEHLKEQLVPKLEQERLYLQGLMYKETLPTFYRQIGEVMTNLAQGEQQIIFRHQGLKPLSRSLEKAGQHIFAGLLLGSLIITFGEELARYVTNPWVVIVPALLLGWFLLKPLIKFTGK